MAPEDRNQIEAELSAYLDGQLSAEDRAALEQQLAGNLGMRRTLRELESTVQFVQGLPFEPSPPGLREDTLGMLERDMLLGPEGQEPAALANRPRRAGRWLATAAVVAMASTAGFFTIRQMRTNEGGPAPAGPAIAMNDAPDPLFEKSPDARPLDKKEDKDLRLDRFVDNVAKPAPASESTEGLGVSSRQQRTAGTPAETQERDRVVSELRSSAAQPQIAMADPDDAPTVLQKSESFRLNESTVPPLTTDEAKTDSPKAEEGAQRSLASSQAAEAKKIPPVQAATPPAPAMAVPPHPRLQVEVGTEQPARMYAMVARAKSFAASEKLQLVPDAKEKNREENEAVAQTIEPENTRRKRGKAVTDTQDIVLRARRSQLKRLLNELRLQDPDSVIRVASGDDVVTGWDSTVTFADQAGGFNDRLEETLGEKSSQAFPKYAAKNVRRDGERAGASQSKQDAAKPEPDQKKEPDRQTLGNAGQTTPKPAAAGRNSSSWVDSLVQILGQAEQSLDPDPITELHLTIRVLTVEPPPHPTQFDDAPGIGLEPQTGSEKRRNP